MKGNSPFNPRVIGLSPLGNNQVEGTGPGETPITDTSTREVPLVYDSITGLWVAPLDKTNQEERLMGLEVARLTMEDQSFLARAGYVQK